MRHTVHALAQLLTMPNIFSQRLRYPVVLLLVCGLASTADAQTIDSQPMPQLWTRLAFAGPPPTLAHEFIISGTLDTDCVPTSAALANSGPPVTIVVTTARSTSCAPVPTNFSVVVPLPAPTNADIVEYLVVDSQSLTAAWAGRFFFRANLSPSNPSVLTYGGNALLKISPVNPTSTDSIRLTFPGSLGGCFQTSFVSWERRNSLFQFLFEDSATLCGVAPLSANLTVDVGPLSAGEYQLTRSSRYRLEPTNSLRSSSFTFSIPPSANSQSLFAVPIGSAWIWLSVSALLVPLASRFLSKWS